MFYQKYLPLPVLRPYIHWFYILEYTGGDSVLDVPGLANPSCALVFNYGDRYQLSNVHYTQELLPTAFFSGVSTEPFTISLRGRVGSLGVIFRAAAFLDSFRLPPLEELNDQRLNASEWAGREMDDFCAQLAATEEAHKKIDLVNQFFINYFGHRQPAIQTADQLANHILEQRGLLSMEALTTRFHVSARHLRRLFKERVGVSPKFYARLKRFGYTHYCLQAGQFNWRHFVGDHGYYDQAHLIRDFKTFSGRPPKLQWRPDEFSH
jgi:AraC-like DNA-binding protein